MEKRWNQYVERYANDPFSWFQSKGFTVSRSNLRSIQRKLHLLQQFVGRRWQSAQRRYTQALERAGLFVPVRARRAGGDYSAIARMNKEVFDSLGLAWITDQSVVEITDAGKQFLRARQRDLPDLVGRQLRRYLFPNPAVGRRHPDAGVFPYLVLLQVLTHFPSGIPSECYELFIARIKSDDDVQWAVKGIQDFARLRPKAKGQLARQLDSLPILKGGRIVAGTRRRSLLNTIRLNRSYMLGLLTTPGLITNVDGKLRLSPSRHAEAEALVQEHLRKECYIEFAIPEDWIAFYGQLDRQPTYQEALAYYSARGDVERSTQAFRAAKSRRMLPAELQALDEGRFRKLRVLEKTLEDFLEFNLDLLEKGLTFIARQYPTATGPLDILAKDRKGRWAVLELKKGRAAERVLGQLLRYRDFIITERAAGRQNNVRGFIIAPEPDRRLLMAARGAAPVPLEVFQFTVRGQAKRLFPSRG